MDILTILGDWLFKGWESIGRVLVVGTLAYAGLLLFLRISGKRTLSKITRSIWLSLCRWGQPCRIV